MKDFSVSNVKLERLQEVAAVWQEEAGIDAFESELESNVLHLIESLAKTGIRRLGPGFNEEVVEVSGSDGHCYALVEMVDSESNRVSKILRFILSPWLWNSAEDAKVRHTIEEVHLAAYTQFIADKVDSGMEEIKVYGRETSRMTILQAIHDHWDADSTGFVASIQGRWLSLRLKKGL